MRGFHRRCSGSVTDDPKLQQSRLACSFEILLRCINSPCSSKAAACCAPLRTTLPFRCLECSFPVGKRPAASAWRPRTVRGRLPVPWKFRSIDIFTRLSSAPPASLNPAPRIFSCWLPSRTLLCRVRVCEIALLKWDTRIRRSFHVRRMGKSGWHRVYRLVKQIPRGRVITYGDVARALRLPGGARTAGRAMAATPSGKAIPWHRVVGAGGKLLIREPYSSLQRKLLESEKVQMTEYRVNMKLHHWKPSKRKKVAAAV